jgi:uncharacterized protein (DUF433 family)
MTFMPFMIGTARGSIVSDNTETPPEGAAPIPKVSKPAGRRRIVSNHEILGGEPVFEGTRIPLSHIASLIASGTDLTEIREDYPSLNEADLKFAAIYARTRPGLRRRHKALEFRRAESDVHGKQG